MIHLVLAVSSVSLLMDKPTDEAEHSLRVRHALMALPGTKKAGIGHL